MQSTLINLYQHFFCQNLDNHHNKSCTNNCPKNMKHITYGIMTFANILASCIADTLQVEGISVKQLNSRSI